MGIDRRVVLGVVVLTGSVLAISCGGEKPAAPAATPPAKVQAPVQESELSTITLTTEAVARLGIQTVLVERKALPRTRTVGGEIVAPPGAETIVTAPFAGTLESPGGVPQAGTVVSRGHALFRLIPLIPSENAARVEAERAVGGAVARQDVATRKVQRAELMLRDGAGSRRGVEEAQGELAVADADVKAARDRLVLAERGNATAAGITLEAPFTGLLRNVHATAGQMVAAGAPLFELVQLDTMWVRVPLYVGETGDIDARAGARVVGLGDPPEAEGLVARPISAPPSADSSTAGVDLYFALTSRAETFRPGQRVGVRLMRKGEASSLVVSRVALLHDAYGGTWVYEARQPNVFVRRRVAVADLVGPLAVLDQGPEPGTRVVTEGAAELFGTEFGAKK